MELILRLSPVFIPDLFPIYQPRLSLIWKSLGRNAQECKLSQVLRLRWQARTQSLVLLALWFTGSCSFPKAFAFESGSGTFWNELANKKGCWESEDLGEPSSQGISLSQRSWKAHHRLSRNLPSSNELKEHQRGVLYPLLVYFSRSRVNLTVPPRCESLE